MSLRIPNRVVIEMEKIVYVPKYERYLTKRSKVKAHNPDEMAATEGDKVIIKECRPLSKTKKFVVTEVLKE